MGPCGKKLFVLLGVMLLHAPSAQSSQASDDELFRFPNPSSPWAITLDGRANRPLIDASWAAEALANLTLPKTPLQNAAPLDGAPTDGSPLDGSPLEGAPLEGAPAATELSSGEPSEPQPGVVRVFGRRYVADASSDGVIPYFHGADPAFDRAMSYYPGITTYLADQLHDLRVNVHRQAQRLKQATDAQSLQGYQESALRLAGQWVLEPRHLGEVTSIDTVEREGSPNVSVAETSTGAPPQPDLGVSPVPQMAALESTAMATAETPAEAGENAGQAGPSIAKNGRRDPGMVPSPALARPIPYEQWAARTASPRAALLKLATLMDQASESLSAASIGLVQLADRFDTFPTAASLPVPPPINR